MNASNARERFEAFMEDPYWDMEEAYEGDGQVACVKDGQVTVTQHNGTPAAFPKYAIDALKALGKDFTVVATGLFDEKTLMLHDLLSLDGRDLRFHPLLYRLKELSGVLTAFEERHRGQTDYIDRAYAAILTLGVSDPYDKREMLERLKDRGVQAVRFRRLDAPYDPDPTHGQFRQELAELDAPCRRRHA